MHLKQKKEACRLTQHTSSYSQLKPLKLIFYYLLNKPNYPNLNTPYKILFQYTYQVFNRSSKMEIRNSESLLLV